MANSALDKLRPLIGLFLVLLGAFITAVGVDLIRDGNQASNWPTVTGEITAAEVIHERRRGASPAIPEDSYQASLSYAYEFGGDQHVGTRFHIAGDPDFRSANRAEQFLAEYPVGTKVVVFVNPKLPDWAVLSTGVPGAATGITTLGAVFLLTGIALLVQWLRARAKRRPKTAAASRPQPAGV